MSLAQLPLETLLGGSRDVATFTLEVLRAESRRESRCALPEAETLIGVPRTILLRSNDVAAASATLRSLRGAVRDALDVQEQHGFSPDEQAELASIVDALRQILEGLIDTQLSFPGEKRANEATSSVKQTVNRVRGTLTGFKSPWAEGLLVEIDQKVKIIDPGGSVVGIDLTR